MPDSVSLVFEAAFWENDEVVLRGGGAGDWENLPDSGLLWVDIHSQSNDPTMRRLQGMDNYWVLDMEYGMTVDVENEAEYGGVFAVAYEFDGHDETVLINKEPPASAYLIAGVLISDEDAAALGLI